MNDVKVIPRKIIINSKNWNKWISDYLQWDRNQYKVTKKNGKSAKIYEIPGKVLKAGENTKIKIISRQI